MMILLATTTTTMATMMMAPQEIKRDNSSVRILAINDISPSRMPCQPQQELPPAAAAQKDRSAKSARPMQNKYTTTYPIKK
mmetsp:Transcript_4931/g.11034  ORF Transcript_4931/g.11034 Transcript_4931/m.11034 type:complete len:81 (-) Transcript_4931:176-418(-)